MKAFQEDEESLFHVLDASPDLMFYQDRQLRYTWSSKTHPPMSLDQVLGKTDMDLFGKEEAAHLMEVKKRALDTGKEGRLEIDLGIGEEKRSYDIVVKPRTGKQGEVLGVAVYLRDITRRKRAQEALRESESLLRGFYDSNDVYMAVFELLKDDFIFIRPNKSFADLHGLDVTELSGKKGRDIKLPEEFIQYWVERFRECGRTGMTLRFEYFYPPSTKERTHLCTISLISDGASPNPRFSFISTDVTENKRAEEEQKRLRDELEYHVRERTTELEESRQRYRDLVELLPEMVFESDVTGRFTYANRQALNTFGYTPDELEKGIRNVDVVAPEDRTRLLESGARILRGERRTGAEYAGRRKDGSEFPIFIRAVAIEKQGRPVGFRGVVIDLTEARKREEEIRRLAIAVEGVAEGVVILSTSGEIVYVNSHGLRMTGYDKHDVVGHHVSIFKNDRHTSSFYKSLWQTVTSGLTWEGRVTVAKKDGSVMQTDTTLSPVRDSSGAVINYAVITRDVTEKLRLEEQLRQAQKMEAIGTLAGGIAHDFNNLLAIIIGNTELSLDDLDDVGAMRGNLNQILKASKRGRDLVKQILAFSRTTDQERKVVAVRPLVEETFSLVRSSLPANIDIRIDMRAREAAVMGNASQLQQIIMNLAANASHAMQDKGGVLTITLDTTRFEAGEPSLPDPDMEPGNYVVLSVRDTGTGMTEKTRKRIFEPFFTTKEAGRGTGMGLAVVYGIVRSHGGALTVYSRPGKGSVFEVFLPNAEPKEERHEEETGGMPGGHDRILFVDDEEAVTRMSRKILGLLGYEVTATTDCIEAWEMVAREPTRFDLVITDQAMPKMTGIALAEKILEVRADMPIILTTGYSETVSPERAKAVGIQEFIMKPLDRKEMAETVRKVLDRRRIE